ncbi:hypothetical protein MLD38_025001 [Melastoma candidum]|uniref:Uncharacterized protein n=1 Tax=Melastoma candidum TaxID=119954 RepID=A0ACB9NU13_9MYRT|nr:hypothetical protein MLD38_025001 [Melastoma candidum]
MFGRKKSPQKVIMLKHNSANPGFPASSGSNPFDSDDEFDTKQKIGTSRRSSSAPILKPPKLSNNPFGDQGGRRIPTSSNSSSLFSSARNNYKNDFRESGGLENQSVQELENYAVYKAEDTTKAVNNCLKIATDMREDAARTLVSLHQQGEQITRAHTVAADMDHDLSRGEKLLGSLGGLFERKWKPKKTRPISGPTITRYDVQSKGSASTIEQREKLGLTSSASKQQPKSRVPTHDPADSVQKVEVEKTKQDDTLSEISNILGELKNMAIDMRTEIESQTEALDGFDHDVDVISDRVGQANRRGSKLLGK